MLWLALVWFVLFAWTVWREPRRMRAGVFLLFGLGTLAVWLFFLIVHGAAWLTRSVPNTAEVYVLLAFLLVIPLTVVVLGVALVLNGIMLIRREGRRLATVLSLGLGLALLVYLALLILTLVYSSAQWFLLMAALGIPATYLAFGFLAYLLYSAIYQAATRRFGKPPRAVVVLGCGLIRGRVPPLLASRLDRGRSVFTRADKAGLQPVMIVSGGRGADETRSEAAAMKEYEVAHGLDPGAVVMEDLSRTTRENLVNTRGVLEARAITGLVAVVTNNFHAFRSALLMRRVGIPGYVLGAPTAGYYWPSATIREYAAILRDHLKLNIVGLFLSLQPLVVWVVAAIAGAWSR